MSGFVPKAISSGSESVSLSVSALHELVPWFIVGFLLLALARSLNIIPTSYVEPVRTIASIIAAAPISFDLTSHGFRPVPDGAEITLRHDDRQSEIEGVALEYAVKRACHDAGDTQVFQRLGRLHAL